ncbi:MAG: hypothetical protein ACKVQQ_19350 [Burkholderiales bacterium]
MNAELHRARAQRIEASLAKCGAADWEIRIEAAMLAGTHWANYALHRHGVSADAEDIVHTSMLVVNTLRKYAIVEADLMRDLGEIEELRPLFVRGDVPGGVEAADRAVDLLRAIRARAERAS